jgi:hypothetical protein
MTPIDAGVAVRGRGLEVALESTVGLFAMSGGLSLMLSPDGSAMGFDAQMLRGSPFSSFLAPGALLFGVGLLHAVAAVLTFVRHRLWRGASFLAGLSLVVFMAAEVALVPFAPRHVGLGVIGLVVALTAIPRRTRQDVRFRTQG